MTTQKASLCCECTPVYDTQYGDERGRSPSVAVVEAIATVEDVEVTELDPLFDEIDPEVLDCLFEQSDVAVPTKSLRFTVSNWNVFIRGDGSIRVCDLDQPVKPAPVFERASGT